MDTRPQNRGEHHGSELILSFVKMVVFFNAAQGFIYMTLFLPFPMRCTFCLLPLRAYCLATRGCAMWGAFCEWAIIFEWTLAPATAKHKHLAIERNMRERLKRRMVHGIVFLWPVYSLSSSSWSINIRLSLFVRLNVRLPLVITAVSFFSLYRCPFIFISLSLFSSLCNRPTSLPTLPQSSRPLCWLHYLVYSKFIF